MVHADKCQGLGIQLPPQPKVDMKRIYVKPPPSPSYLENGVFRINNGHNIFWNMDTKLAQKRIRLQTIDMDEKIDGDLYIYSDAPYPWEAVLWKRTVATKDKNILFSFESPIVNPFSHLRTLHRFFRKVYTWDDGLVDNKKYFKFFIPQLQAGLHTKPVAFTKKKFLTFINAKKDVPFILPLLSPYKENLYKKRFRAVDFFSKRIPSEFTFYGRGWDKPIPWDIKERLIGVKKHKAYKGELRGDKIKALSGYKFCLCFENAVAPGYITEKIFDCFKARCIPIYWGAPDVTNFIDKNCFIDFREFMDYEKLLLHLRNISEKTYDVYTEAIEKFLGSRDTQSKWFDGAFIKTVFENV